MKKRFFILGPVLVIFIGLLFIPSTYSQPVCDNDGICENGEDLVFCFDCTDAYCGDGWCDTGLNEEQFGTPDYCQQDCGLNNGQACSQNLECISSYCSCGICSATPPPACCTDSDCDDSDPQTVDSCSGGQCIYSDPCPGANDYWDGSQCVCSPAYYGDCDGNTATGCETNLNTDGNNCGACNNVCDDGFACTTDSCNSGTCQYTDTCPAGKTCTASGCVSCTDNSQCTSPPNTQCYNPTGICSGGSCTYAPLTGQSCNDNNACTQNDICDFNGDCTGTPITCDTPPNIQCYLTPGACSGGICSYTVNTGSSCSDADSCTTNDQCQNDGSCSGTAITCNTPQNTLCYSLTGTCSAGTCSYNVLAGQSCGTNKLCDANGNCVCSSGYTGCAGSCVDTQSDPSNCGSCGNSCFAGETCINGICSVCTTDSDCDDGNDCTTDTCNTAAGTCTNNNVADNTGCNDNELCTINDKCFSGVCSGTPKNCDDSNECTTDSCNSATGSCVNADMADNTATSYENVICMSGYYDCAADYYNIDSFWSTGCEYFCEYKGAEACDVSSIDENCNNQFNENCLCADGTTQACGLSKGECSQGTMACAGGSWGDCTNYIGPTEEICDTLDNNCDGQVDEGFADNDNDGFASCLDCDDNDRNKNPNATEICDLKDNNCDGERDEGCTCDVLKNEAKKVLAEIDFPGDDANFFAGNKVNFLAEDDDKIEEYMWEYGDSIFDYGKENEHAYASEGDYDIKLTVLNKFNPGCQDIRKIKIHVKKCKKDKDCDDDLKCHEGRCLDEEEEEEEELLIITINSPTNQVYAQKNIPLSISKSKKVECSFSLNNGNFVTIHPDLNAIEGKEGLNSLAVRCGNTTVQRQFTVKLKEKENILNGLGDEPETSIITDIFNREEEVTVTPDQAREVISDVIEHQGLEITKTREASQGKSLIILSIKNLLPISFENTKIKVTVPKVIAEKAGEIKSAQNFSIVKDDPVIEFLLQLLKTEAIITFEVNKVVDEEMLNQITAEPEEDLISLMNKLQETAKAVKITKEYDEIERNGSIFTRITTRIKPSRELKGMALIEKIPKCLAKQIDFIKMDEKYKNMIKIINPDPLIMWQFEEITKEDAFSYEVKGVLSEDCKSQIRSLGIADELGLDIDSESHFRIMLPLLLIPIIGLLIIYFQRFHPQKGEKKAVKEKPGKSEPKKQPSKPKKMDFDKLLEEEIKKAEKELKKEIK